MGGHCVVHYVTKIAPRKAWSKRHFPNPYFEKERCGHNLETDVDDWLCDPTTLLSKKQGYITHINHLL